MVQLIPNEQTSSDTVSHNTLLVQRYNFVSVKFDFKVNPGYVDNQVLVATNREHAAINYLLNLNRKSTFFIVYYIIPSLFLVVISYASFWIDKTGVPGRSSLPCICILSIISLLRNSIFDIPQLSYTPWLSQYFTGIFIFISIALVEYAAISFFTVHYNSRKAQIDKHLVKLSSYEVKKSKQAYVALIQEREKHDVMSDSLDRISFATMFDENEKDSEQKIQYDGLLEVGRNSTTQLFQTKVAEPVRLLDLIGMRFFNKTLV